MTDTPGTLLHNLLLFGRVLHGLGLEATPGRMIEVQEALRHVQIGYRRDFYYALRAYLVKRRQDLPLFDQAFDLFWRKPPEGGWDLDLDDLLGLRRPEPPQPEKRLIIFPQAEPEQTQPPQDDVEPREVVELTRTYSAREQLRHKDFAALTPEEFAAIKQMMAALVWQVGRRTTRRYAHGRDRILDLRRSLRRNLRHGGELLLWSYRAPKTKPRPLVIIADISGSMEPYTRLLLHFMYGLVHGQARRVEVFLFATRLTRISRQLRAKDVDRAVDDVAHVVRDWAGGTRMGDALKSFNFDWGRRVLRGGPVVLLIGDGWDRGDPELLGREMGRLHRFCRRIIWLNPLLSSPHYEPLTRGMQAALPFVDDFLPVHNLASLEELTGHLNRLDRRRALRPQAGPTQAGGSLQGAAFAGGARRRSCRK